MLQDHDRRRIEHRLLREREEALDAIEHFDERVADLRDRAGELSLYRSHPADIGSESNEQEQDLMLTSMEGRRLYVIDEALSRLYKTPESFGVCDRCGREIEVERLDIIPETRLCAKCAREVEAGADANPREAGPPVS